KVLRRVLDDARRPPPHAVGAAPGEGDELAYVVAHDLRQPVTQIARFLDLLAEGAEPRLGAGDRELLAAARRGARSLASRVDGLQPSAGLGRDETPAAVALEPLLAHVVERLAEEVQATAAEITHDPLPTVEASAPQLEQLLQNLLGNALKFRRG